LKRRDFKFDVKTTIIIQFVLEKPELPPRLIMDIFDKIEQK